MLLFTNTHHTISGREGHARVVDDDLQTSIGSPAVLERVLNFGFRTISTSEVVLAHGRRAVAQKERFLVVEADRGPGGLCGNQNFTVRSC